MSRVFSAQHFGAISNYNVGDLELQNQNEDESDEGSDTFDNVGHEAFEEVQIHGQEDVPEVRMGVRECRDLEANRLEKMQSTQSIKDPNLVSVHIPETSRMRSLTRCQVSWEGPDGPENPKDWSLGMKWAATAVVSSFTFISPVSSSTVAQKNNDTGHSKFRVPIMVPGSFLVPVGLFIYAWTAQKHTHRISPNIGAAIFSAGVIIGFQGIQTYIVDAYTRFAASAIASATVLRSLAGFGFPLFAPTMYKALDYGWGNSLLGFIAIGLDVPAPTLLWFFGQRLRERSTFADGGY